MRVFSLVLAAVAVLASFFIAAVLAASGGDVSSLFSRSDYECAKRNGWDFVIVRGYCSYGGVDPNGLVNLNNAKAAGIPTRDVYHFPCIGKSAKAQVQATHDHFAAEFAAGAKLWFDIETNPSPGCGYRTPSDNCKFIGDLIDAADSLGIHSGVYSSPYEWESVAGSGCRVGKDKNKKLWWADYNGQENFDGFGSFGGWEKGDVAIHQWNDNGDICGISFDKNWKP